MWIPIVVYELIIFALAVAIGFRQYKALLLPPYLHDQPVQDTLPYILLRDSILYPFM